MRTREEVQKLITLIKMIHRVSYEEAREIYLKQFAVQVRTLEERDKGEKLNIAYNLLNRR